MPSLLTRAVAVASFAEGHIQNQKNARWVSFSSLNSVLNPLLMFPLKDFTQTFSVGKSQDCDLTLNLSNVDCLLHVKNGTPVCRFCLRIARISRLGSVWVGAVQVMKNDTILLAAWTKDERFIIYRNNIDIGPSSYNISVTDSPSTKFYRQFKRMCKCYLCNRFSLNTLSLPCNHALCSICYNDEINHVLAQVNRQVELQISQHREIIFELPKLSCSVCLSTFLLSDVMDNVNLPFTTLQTVRNILCTWNAQHVVPVICNNCGNTRCHVNLCDYFFCFTCKQNMCPLCCLDIHRYHQLMSFNEVSFTRRMKYKRNMMRAFYKNRKLNTKEIIGYIIKYRSMVDMLFEFQKSFNIGELETNLNKVHSMLLTLMSIKGKDKEKRVPELETSIQQLTERIEEEMVAIKRLEKIFTKFSIRMQLDDYEYE